MITRIKNNVFFAGAFVSLVLLILPTITAAQELPKSVAIATHRKGSSLNAVGSGIAKVITAHTPISATDRPYTGYIAWVPLMNKGSVAMGVIATPDLYNAYRGIEPYKEKYKNLRLISSGSYFKTGYIARVDSGIKSIADLKGKRATINPASMNTKRNVLNVIRAAGLDPHKDVTLIPVAGVVACIDALIEGRADAAWASVGMGKVKEAAAKLGGVYWVSVCESADDAKAQYIRKHSPGMDVVFIKAGSGSGVKNDAWVLKHASNLATHKGLGSEAAYLFTKAVWENHEELAPIHPMLKRWVKNMVSEHVAVPYHSGAVRFYKEIGVWSDKMAQLQQKLLSE